MARRPYNFELADLLDPEYEAKRAAEFKQMVSRGELVIDQETAAEVQWAVEQGVFEDPTPSDEPLPQYGQSLGSDSLNRGETSQRSHTSGPTPAPPSVQSDQINVDTSDEFGDVETPPIRLASRHAEFDIVKKIMELGDDIRLAAEEGKDTTDLKYEQRVWSRLRIDASVGLVQSGEELEAFQKKIDAKYNPEEDPLLDEKWQMPRAKLSSDLALKQLGINREKQSKKKSRGKPNATKLLNNPVATGRVSKNNEGGSRNSTQRSPPTIGTTWSLRSGIQRSHRIITLDLKQSDATVANSVAQAAPREEMSSRRSLHQTSDLVFPESSLEPAVTATVGEITKKKGNVVRLHLKLNNSLPETEVEGQQKQKSDIRESEKGTRSHTPSGLKPNLYLPLEKWWLRGVYCLWQDQQEMKAQIPRDLRITHGNISEDFNKTFSGRLVEKCLEPRPERTAAAMQLYYAHHLKGKDLKAPIPDYWAEAGMAKPVNISLDNSAHLAVHRRKILTPRSRIGVRRGSDLMDMDGTSTQRPVPRLKLNFTPAGDYNRVEEPVPTTSNQSRKRKLSQNEEKTTEMLLGSKFLRRRGQLEDCLGVLRRRLEWIDGCNLNRPSTQVYRYSGF